MEETTIKVTVELPSEVWNRVETAAEAEGISPAEILTRLATDVFVSGIYDDEESADEDTEEDASFSHIGSPI